MNTTTANSTLHSSSKLESIGAGIIRYGLAIVLIWVGFLKFSPYEAEGIKPLVEHSPFLSWTLGIVSINSLAMILGIIEIILGILIMMRNFSPKASALGSIGAIIMFAITLTFVFSTPGIWQPDYGFPYLSPMPGQFLAKDILLLGAAVWTAGEALNASRMVTTTHKSVMLS
ncbi:MAG: DUF417 family protein [Ferruginibacter sp.]